jgi:branched-chain amino acid aminotransferase
VAWRGPEVIGIDPTDTSIHLAVIVLPWPRRPRAPVSLCISRWARPAPDAMPMQAKASCHYVTGALALQEARAAGYDDALLLDHRGCVAEATGANFFMVRGDVVTTPTTESALDGITRRKVMTLARELGLTVSERGLSPAELREADELFLTGTACEVQPVQEVASARPARPGRVTQALAEAYAQLTLA